MGYERHIYCLLLGFRGDRRGARYSFGVKKEEKYKHKLSILCFRFAVCLRVYVFRSCLCCSLCTTDGQGIFICWCLCIVSAPKRDVIKCIKYETFFCCVFVIISYILLKYYIIRVKDIFLFYGHSHSFALFACLPYRLHA